MLSLPGRFPLIAAFCVAGVFAVPIVTFVSAMVVFPILFYGALAIFVNVGLLALPIAYSLRRFGVFSMSPALWQKWILSAIVWSGCAFGIAHWGDVGATMGATNTPFLKVFFAPVLMLFGYQIG